MKKILFTLIVCFMTSALVFAADEVSVSSITISPEEVSVAAGETVSFEASALDSLGTAQDVELTWSLAGEIGTISDDGELTTTTAGTGVVTVAYGDITAQATVTVTEAAGGDGEGGGEDIVPVAISPEESTVEVGDTIEFEVTVTDTTGAVVENPEVTWAVADTLIGTIDENGVFTAVAAGATTVTVASGENSATATVTVTEAEEEDGGDGEEEVKLIEIFPATASVVVGETIQFEAALKDSAGNELEITEITWSVDDTARASIDETGLFTAITEGEVTVNAMIGLLSAEAEVTITGTGELPEGVNTVTVQRQHPDGKITQFGSAIIENNTITLGGIPYPFNYLNGGSLFFPENSLSDDIVITIKLPAKAKQSNSKKDVEFEGDIVSAVTFEVSVAGEAIHPFYFDEPIVLTLPFKRGLLKNLDIDPMALGMYYIDEEGNLQEEGITDVVVDTDANTITGSIAHFSDIAIAPQNSPTTVEENPVPETVSLAQNVPNPFNPTTTISFRISEASNVELSIFNVIGQEVRSLDNSFRNPGSYSVVWDGKDNSGRMVNSGVYFYRLRAGSHSMTRKLMMLK